MPRKESEAVPEGNGPVSQQEEFGSGEPTLVDIYRMFDGCFDRWDRKLEKSRIRTSQREASLEHDARQPRLAMEADGPADTKTRERTEGTATAALQAMHGDSCTAQKVQDGPKTSTIFGVKAEPPDLPCKEAVSVENGAASLKSCLSSSGMCSPTVAGDFLPTGEVSTNKAQGTNFLPQLLPWSFRETSEDKCYKVSSGAFTRELTRNVKW